MLWNRVNGMRDWPKRRRIVQFLWGLLTNAHLSGWLTGRIYQGPLKQFCVPGMNCYACPAAVGACPLGSLQAFLSARKPKAPLYVLGFLTMTGVLLGRFICGWLCLFGLIQELLYRIPTPKVQVPERADRVLRKGKYLILAVFVVLLPLVLRDGMGVSFPYFCKWICPVGTLEGGIPLVILNEGLRHLVHGLYAWKLVVLAAVVGLSVVIHRPFCKYICPLGAFYALFQKIGFLRLVRDESACTNCGACAHRCAMQVDPVRDPDSTECIRCGVCVQACPQHALRFAAAGSEDLKERKTV